MNDSQNDDRAPEQPVEQAQPAEAPARKRYRSPQLVEYGSVAKLTQGTLSMNADFFGGGFRMDQMCL